GLHRRLADPMDASPLDCEHAGEDMGSSRESDGWCGRAFANYQAGMTAGVSLVFVAQAFLPVFFGARSPSYSADYPPRNTSKNACATSTSTMSSMRTRREILSSMLAAPLIRGAQTAPRPNIVFILMDDL